MKAYLERTREWVDTSASNVADLLRELALNPQTVLVVRKDKLLASDTVLLPDDEVTVMSVISGG